MSGQNIPQGDRYNGFFVILKLLPRLIPGIQEMIFNVCDISRMVDISLYASLRKTALYSTQGVWNKKTLPKRFALAELYAS